MVTWARTNVPHVDGRHETAQFIDYWASKAGAQAVKLDWVRTWQVWMRNAATRTAGPPVPIRMARAVDEQCPTHRGELARNCGPCAGDRKAAAAQAARQGAESP
jgi:hypothetical protein